MSDKLAVDERRELRRRRWTGFLILQVVFQPLFWAYWALTDEESFSLVMVILFGAVAAFAARLYDGGHRA